MHPPRTASASSPSAEPSSRAAPGSGATERRSWASPVPRRRSPAPGRDGRFLAGPPGAGKTRRVAAHVADALQAGADPASMLVLALSAPGAAGLSAAIQRALAERPGEAGRDSSGGGRLRCEPPPVLTPWELGLGLLRGAAQHAGGDPFVVTATKAERLAMLLARTRGARGRKPLSPAAAMPMLRAIERIDRLKAALVDAERYAARSGRADDPVDGESAVTLDGSGAANSDHVGAASSGGGSAATPDCADARNPDGADARNPDGADAGNPGGRWAVSAATEPAGAATTDFAALFLEHERVLAEHGALDHGDLLLRSCALLRDGAGVARRLLGPYSQLVVDGVEDPSPACATLLRLAARHIQELTAAGTERDLRAVFGAEPPGLVVLGHSQRPRAIVEAAAAAPATARRASAPTTGRADPAAGPLSFWRCADERSQAEIVAADIERLVGERAARGADEHPAGRRPVAVIVRSLAREAPALAGALKGRAIPHRVLGGCAFFESPEVRDALAWLRVLRDSSDAAAGMRLLMRPPVQLRPVELAHISQLARRRRLGMLAAAAAAVDSDVLSPEARRRVAAALEVHEGLLSGLGELRPHELVHQLVERTGLRRVRLLPARACPPDGLLGLGRLEELAAHFLLACPGASCGELAAYLVDTAAAGLALDLGLGEEPVAAEERWWPQPGVAGHVDRDVAVDVLELATARGREYDYVYIMGLAGVAVGGGSAAAQAQPGKAGGSTGAAAGRLGQGGWSPAVDSQLHMAMGAAGNSLVLCYPARARDGAVQAPLAAADHARRLCGGAWEERSPIGAEGPGALDAGLRVLRERALADIARVGGSLGELRLDTDYDISQGVVRYLELLKLAALRERPASQPLDEALADLNARLLGACTPLQREVFEGSELDDALRAALQPPAGAVVAAPLAAALRADDVSLAPLLPRHGPGLVLSASDIATYRDCPLRYKFTRLLRIPVEPTPQQRFGIMMHQVLERYHSALAAGQPAAGAGDTGDRRAAALGGEGAKARRAGSRGQAGAGDGSLASLLGLLGWAWRRAGFRAGPQDRELMDKARAALGAYHRRLAAEDSQPMWFERGFSFAVGPHVVRGRVDRVDRLPGGGYELIDYKTGYPRTAAQLDGDIQLSLYAMAAREAWSVEARKLSYYYLLDDRKVPLPGQPGESQVERITETIRDVGDRIAALRFAPAPSYGVCSTCDFLAACPAAES